MATWKEYKLSELVDIIGGGTPKTTIPEYWNGDIPWVSVVDFGNSRKYVYNTEKSITKKGLDNSSTKVLRRGQIIISARGTVGELAVLGQDMAFNQSCYGLDAKNNICTNDFLYYLLKIKIDELKRNAHGAVFDTITRSTFETISADIPDLPTQTAIAEILSSLDDKIELNNQINQELEALAQALFKHWFIDFEFPNEEGKPYKSSGGEMVESELGEIPKGWSTETLSEVAQLIRGISYSRDELVSPDEGVPFVNLKCFALDGTFRQDGLKFYNGKYKTEQLISRDDILVAVTDLTQARDIIGMPLLWASSKIAVPSLDTCLIRPKHELLTAYLYYEFKTFRYKSRIIEFANGSTVLHLSIKGLQTYLLPMPQKHLLAQWNDTVNPIIAHINSNIAEINELSGLRDTLLPKLISGERKVSGHNRKAS